MSRILPQIDASQGLEIGLYTLGDHLPGVGSTGRRISAQERLEQIIEMAKFAEEAGFDVFGVGESHQPGFVTQAHMVVLGAIARETSRIKLNSAATMVSVLDPVRVYEDAATVNLLSNGRFELVAGRASRLGLFDLFGYDVKEYEPLFEEKFDLLLQINENECVTWEGKYRPALEDMPVLPRANDLAQVDQDGIPIWRAVGGTLSSAYKAGEAGVPLYLAHLTGGTATAQLIIKGYRKQLEASNYDPAKVPVTTAGFLTVRETTEQAVDFYAQHLSKGFKASNGRKMPMELFNEVPDVDNIINVGSPELVIDKLLHQHEVFNNQRYVGQIDFNGVPHLEIMKTIEMLGEKVIPEVKKATRTNS